MKRQQVVVAYDFSPMGAAVLARAVALVSRAPFHTLHFVTVVEGVDYEYADKLRERLADEVRKAFGSVDPGEQIHYFAHARIGKPAEEIVDLAEELGADLILVGTHGRTGVPRLVMGSTAEHVVREAGCPVLVVRPKRYPDIELATITTLDGPHPRASSRRFTLGSASAQIRPIEWNVP
jgi:nucleotide-binding universal stress UspA family protein